MHMQRFWIETIVTALTSVLAVMTLLFPTWIESLLHVDPDLYSGSLEWTIALVFALVALTLFILAGFEWQRIRAKEAA